MGVSECSWGGDIILNPICIIVNLSYAILNPIYVILNVVKDHYISSCLFSHTERYLTKAGITILEDVLPETE